MRFFILLIAVFTLCSCHRSGNKGNSSVKDTVFFPDLIKVAITGETKIPDSAKVLINTDENTLQPLLQAYVKDGRFQLEGELAEPNFYNLVIQGQKFKVYLENGKSYQLVVDQYNGNQVVATHFETNSEAMNEYYDMLQAFEQEKRKLSNKSAGLREQFDNPKTYSEAVERSGELRKERNSLYDDFKKSYIEKAGTHPALKLFLMKEEQIGRANYAKYAEILETIPDSLKGISLYRVAEKKVSTVRDFYENMPDFPNIIPRNPNGDSLRLANYKDQKALLLVFWSSWNSESKDDIRQIKNQSASMAASGIKPIFLTWEKNYEDWKKASGDLGISKDSYRLNVTDANFMSEKYGVTRLPHYILVNASDLSIINHSFTYPLNGKLIEALQQRLNEL